MNRFFQKLKRIPNNNKDIKTAEVKRESVLPHIDLGNEETRERYFPIPRDIKYTPDKLFYHENTQFENIKSSVDSYRGNLAVIIDDENCEFFKLTGQFHQKDDSPDIIFNLKWFKVGSPNYYNLGVGTFMFKNLISFCKELEVKEIWINNNSIGASYSNEDLKNWYHRFDDDIKIVLLNHE